MVPALRLRRSTDTMEYLRKRKEVVGVLNRRDKPEIYFVVDDN